MNRDEAEKEYWVGYQRIKTPAKAKPDLQAQFMAYKPYAELFQPKVREVA